MSFKSPESLFACTVALSTCNTAALLLLAADTDCIIRTIYISEVIKLLFRANTTTVGLTFLTGH